MKTNYLKTSVLASSLALLVFTSCEQEEIGMSEVPLTELHASMAAAPDAQVTVETVLECAQPATATASSTYWAATIGGAIDCDTSDQSQWNSGGWAPSFYKITFESARVFSGVYITSGALPAETQNYKVTATRPDNSTVIIAEPFTVGDLSNSNSGGISSKVFDLGEGFQEYTSVRIDILGYTRSWKSILEVELIAPAMSADSDGDGINDDEDAFPNSNLEATIVIGSCDTEVANQLMADGATFSDLIGAIEGSNHGKYVNAVSKLADSWKKSGLISGQEKGKITSCAAQNK